MALYLKEHLTFDRASMVVESTGEGSLKSLYMKGIFIQVLEAGHLLLQHRSASSSRLSLDFPDLPGKPAYTLKPGQPSPGQHSLLRPPFAVTPSTGILTCFPSTTPKARQRCVVDGKQVNIPVPMCSAMWGRRRLAQPGVGCPGSSV